MGYWLSHVWQSVLIEIQFINPVIRTTIESVKCFFHAELMSVWPSTAILINYALFFHLVHSSSLEIYNFMLIYPLFVCSIVFIWQSFRFWPVHLFSYRLVCACAFNIISVRTCHFPEFIFSLSHLYLRMHWKYIKICFHKDHCIQSPVISLSWLLVTFFQILITCFFPLSCFKQFLPID